MFKGGFQHDQANLNCGVIDIGTVNTITPKLACALTRSFIGRQMPASWRGSCTSSAGLAGRPT
jgi:hypothetical protein